MEKTLLLVDDEPHVRRSLMRELNGEGYRILEADSGSEGLDILAHEHVDVILSDHRMPVMTGAEFLTRVHRQYPQAVRMVLSGHADFEAVLQAINQGDIYKFFLKPWEGDVLRRELQQAFCQRVSVNAIRDPAGNISNYAALLLDITEQKKREMRIHQLSYFDALTGLPNRRLLGDRLEQAITQAQLSGERVAVLLLEITRWRHYRSLLGTKLSQRLMKRIVRDLHSLVPEGATLAQCSSSELALLLPRAEKGQLEAIAKAVVRSFKEPLAVCGEQLQIAFSIGAALSGEGLNSAESLLQAAGTSLSQSRHHDQAFRCYTDAQGRARRERWELERGLHQALPRNQLEVHYQPEICPSSGRIRCIEALLRWRHPERGLVPPGKFISLAEESGLIHAMGKWCLYEACFQVKQWHIAGFDELKVSVNVSALQFLAPDWVEIVESTLSGLDFPARHLILEVTESVLMADEEAILAAMQRLHIKGVSFALDDFGTGYSNFDYIRRFPFRYLKIDQSFVRNLPHNNDDATIVETMVGLAKSLNLEVVAEGVETDQQHQFLRAKQCDLLQGFLFSMPLPPSQLTRLLVQTDNRRQSDAAKNTALCG